MIVTIRLALHGEEDVEARGGRLWIGDHSQAVIRQLHSNASERSGDIASSEDRNDGPIRGTSREYDCESPAQVDATTNRERSRERWGDRNCRAWRQSHRVGHNESHTGGNRQVLYRGPGRGSYHESGIGGKSAYDPSTLAQSARTQVNPGAGIEEIHNVRWSRGCQTAAEGNEVADCCSRKRMTADGERGQQHGARREVEDIHGGQEGSGLSLPTASKEYTRSSRNAGQKRARNAQRGRLVGKRRWRASRGRQ